MCYYLIVFLSFAYLLEKMWCHRKHKAKYTHWFKDRQLALCCLYCYLTLVNETFSETSSPWHWWIYSSTFEWPGSKMLVQSELWNCIHFQTCCPTDIFRKSRHRGSDFTTLKYSTTQGSFTIESTTRVKVQSVSYFPCVHAFF